MYKQVDSPNSYLHRRCTQRPRLLRCLQYSIHSTGVSTRSIFAFFLLLCYPSPSFPHPISLSVFNFSVLFHLLFLFSSLCLFYCTLCTFFLPSSPFMASPSATAFVWFTFGYIYLVTTVGFVVDQPMRTCIYSSSQFFGAGKLITQEEHIIYLGSTQGASWGVNLDFEKQLLPLHNYSGHLDEKSAYCALSHHLSDSASISQSSSPAQKCSCIANG